MNRQYRSYLVKQLNLTKKEDVVPIFFDEISRLVPKLTR